MTPTTPDISDYKSLQARLERLEAESAVARLMGEYMSRCDVTDELLPDARRRVADGIAELFVEDAIWEGVGRSREEFGRLVGRDAIRNLFAAPAFAGPRFLHNFHFLNTPRIQADGAEATGHWTLLCALAYGDGRRIWRVARNHVNFSCRNSTWMIRHFRAETLYTCDR